MASKKTTLVFIHYFGGNGGSWKWLSKKLPKKFDCVYLTLPGFDNTQPLEEKSIRSFSQWISDEIKNRDINDYILIGHSMGGKLALFTSFINHDFLPKKIILIAPSPLTTEAMDEDEKQLMLHNLDRQNAITTVQSYTNKTLSDKRFNYAVDSQLNTDKETWNWWINKGLNTDIKWAIKNLGIPTFVICSRSDSFITTEVIQKDVLPYLNKAKLITIGRSGHLIPIESPRKLARITKKILKY